MIEAQDVRQRYEQALETLVDKLKQDSYVIAAVLLGSLSYDTVWEHSDIDLVVVTQEVKQKANGFCLTESGIDIHTILIARSEFRRALEGSVQSSFMHSLLTKGRMIFCRDEPLADLFAAREQLGERDRAIQLLQRAASLLPCLTKAEKWFHVKQDMDYCFLWIMRCIDPLAAIEALLHGEITGREVIHQALRHNPDFFGAIYTDLIRQEKTPERLLSALVSIRGYVRDRIDLLFQPLLTYLAEAGGVRSITEISHYFSNQMNLPGLDTVCEWLADQDIIQKLSTPLRLTEKSRVDVQETAYYYEGDL